MKTPSTVLYKETMSGILQVPVKKLTGSSKVFGMVPKDVMARKDVSPAAKLVLAAMGMEAQGSTAQELDAYDRSELERWRDVVKASGYVPE